MRRKLNVFWFAILAVFVWSGLSADTLAANQMPVQVKPTIEHMKVFRQSVGTLDYEETWFNSSTGDWRSDLFSYNSKTPVNGTFLRSIVTERGYREYLFKTGNGGLTGETWINREPNKRPYQSLFQDVAKEYKKSCNRQVKLNTFC